MSRFLDSISIIISTFHKHAKEDGDYSNLSRRRMKQFIQREFADVIAKPRDPQTIDKILQFLEWDGDGEIDFNEFLLLVFRVAKACYWYLPKGPCLLQRTELTTSEKSLQEPEVKNSRRVTEGDSQSCESNHHPPCEPELQRETGINELETPEEAGSHRQQCNTQSRNNAKRCSEPEEPIPQVYEERSQEPCDQRKSQRRRQPLEQDRQGDVQACKRGSLQAHEPGVQADERKNQERPQPEQLADVRSRSQTYEPQPLPNRWSSRQPQEPALPANDQKNQRPQEAHRGSHNQPRKPELLTGERKRYHVRELEQKALEQRSHQKHEPESLDSTRPYQSYIQEPLELDLRNDDTCEPEREMCAQEKKQERKITSQESERDIHQDEKRDEQALSREEPVRERRIDRQRELEVEVYERRSRQTREREERGDTTDPRETCERRDSQTREPEDDGRRQRESCFYRTVELDNRVLCPQGEQASVTDVRVHYIPTEPDVPPEVQVIPQPCEPQTIAYLIHVIQNLNDPEATTYKIMCQQPHNLGQPIYVKKCSVSPQPLADPCDKSNPPESRPQRDERETGEPELPRQGGTPGVKDGGHQASASEQDGVKGDICWAKLKEDRRDSQHPKMCNTEEKKHQPQGDGAKAAREQVPREPDSSCQVRYHEDREAKSCPPLPQAPEPRAEPPWRDEPRCCREDAELAPREKSRQPRQEEKSKRSARPVSDAQLQWEEEPRLCTKQSQGPPGPPVSQEAPSRRAGDEAKAS
ncbi:unnamed protein product [Bubo scandiacus]